MFDICSCSESSKSYVGKFSLAVAVGIGTVATGFCACATAGADTGDRGSSAGGSNSSTSQSSDSGARKTARSGAAASTIRTPRPAQASDSPIPASVPRAVTGRNALGQVSVPSSSPNESSARPVVPSIKFDVPQPAASPAAAASVAVPVASPAPAAAATPPLALVTTQQAPTVEPAAASASNVRTSVPLPSAALSAASQVPRSAVPIVRQAAAVAAPSALQTSITTALNKIVTTLTAALSGGTPTTPVDASLALMLGAARRDVETGLRPQSAVSRVVAAATATSSTTTPTVEAEKMAVSNPAGGRVVRDSSASSGSALAITGSGTASATMNITASTAVTIRARASAGSPNMTITVDGVPITTVVVSSTAYGDYTYAGKIAAGSHVITVSSSNASAKSTLYLDKVSTTTGTIGEQFTGKSGSAPGSNYWTVITGTGWDSGIQNYASKNSYLDGQGRLVLQATRGSNGTWTSGRIETANKLSYGYGTVTARIKVPKGQGLWPAFWMIGADAATNGWPQTGEIDVMELPSTTTTMYSTLHGPIDGSSATQQAQIISTLSDLSNDYHSYWVRHLEDEITFGVDNQVLGTLTPDDLQAGETWVYNRPMSVILNVAVGGGWAGDPDRTTPTTAKMLVESVIFEAA